MATVGHLVVGLVAARLRPSLLEPSVSRVGWACGLVALSFLPDADVVAFVLGIPYAAPFGHRGAAHSLVFAAVCALILALAVPFLRRPDLGLLLFTVVASHGVLDSFTDGGLGIAFLWPFSNQRFFAPWRPIPVAPIGPRLLSAPGLAVMMVELLIFLPLVPLAFWPRRERRA
jgi:inner membrane protein